MILPQSETEEILERRLAELGTHVEREMDWVDLHQDGDSVIPTVVNHQGQGTKIAADYVLAADGAHSGIRKKLELDFPGHSASEQWHLADGRCLAAC